QHLGSQAPSLYGRKKHPLQRRLVPQRYLRQSANLQEIAFPASRWVHPPRMNPAARNTHLRTTYLAGTAAGGASPGGAIDNTIAAPTTTRINPAQKNGFTLFH